MPDLDFDKLFKYLILFMVVAGPVLAAVAKKLIAFFSPESPNGEKPPELPKLPARPKVEVLEARRPPVLPFAAPQPVARPVARRAASARPVARLTRPPKLEPITLEAIVEDHLGHLTSEVEDEGKRLDQGVEGRLGHIKTTVRPATALSERLAARHKESPVPSAPTSLRRVSRQGLRRAIVLREVLGPPVAFRASDDQW